MYQGVKRGEMRSRELSVEETPAEYSFAEGEHTFTLSPDGIKYISAGTDGKEERFYSYTDVKFYRALFRENASGAGQEKLYLTVPVPTLTSYNRRQFKIDDRNYFTHEFSREEKGNIEEAIGKFQIPVIDKRRDAGAIRKLYRTFREDGGLSHRIVAISVFVIVALVIGALIMYLINYFLHTDTDTLAIVFGIFCLPCLAFVVVKSQELGSKIKIYDKGVYLKIRSKSGYGGTTSPFAIEKAFFTWEEVECVEKVQSQVDYIVQFRLGYCIFSVPDFDGLYEYLTRRFPEKCVNKEA